MMDLVNPEHFTAEARAKLKNEFTNGFPYKHLVIDQFLKPEIAQAMVDRFPSYESFNKKYDGLNEKKAEGSNFEDFDPLFTEIKNLVSSKEMCQWVTDVTGLTDVFVTNDALGTGLHMGTRGSFLDVHVDFSMHHIEKVYRRLNLLIFLNPGWQDEWNGHTELWNADMTKLEKKVRPDFNRAVIFETNNISYHGYAKINPPEGIARRSFYTYFYTHYPHDGGMVYHDTIFKARPEEGTLKKIKTDVKETTKNFIKRQLLRVGFKF